MSSGSRHTAHSAPVSDASKSAQTTTLALPGGNDRNLFDDLWKIITIALATASRGKAVHIAFRDFSPSAVSGVCAQVAHQFKPREIADIWTSADVERVRRRLHKVKVILVYHPRGASKFASALIWMIERHQCLGRPLPIVMAVYDESLEECPGAILVADGNQDVSRAFEDLLHRKSADWPPLHSTPLQDQSVNCQKVLDAVQAAAVAKDCPLIPKTRELLARLLAGRMAQTPDEKSEQSESIVVDGYADVVRLLQCPLLRQPQESVDDLTCVMVSRGNEYLRISSGQRKAPKASAAPFGSRRGAQSTTGKIDVVDHAGQEATSFRRFKTITFVEMANLGRTGSPEFQLMLTALGGDADALKQVGIVLTARSPPRQSVRQPAGFDAATTVWSYKQVRTRFERLRKAGLIETRRTAANAPFQYVLPVEMHVEHLRFQQLPSIADVRQELSRQRLPGRPAVPAACPARVASESPDGITT